MDVWVLKHIVDFYFNRMRILPNREFYQGYIGAQKDITQVTILNGKVWGSAAKLNRTSGKKWRWIVKLWTVTDSFAEQCM